MAKLPFIKDKIKKPSASKTKGRLIMEVGRSLLKIAVVEKKKNKDIVQRMLIREFKNGEELAGIVDSEKMREYSDIFIIITRDQVTVRNLELPTVEEREIRDIVEIQSAKQTPFTKDEIISDYLNLGSMRENYTKVLLAIIQKKVVDELLGAFGDLKRKVKRIALSSECLTGWTDYISESVEDKNYAVVYTEGCNSDLCVFSDGKLLYTRILQFNPLIISADSILNFVDEAVCSLKDYESNGVGPEINQVLLCGDETATKEIYEHIMQNKSVLESEKAAGLSFSLLPLGQQMEGLSYADEPEIALKSAKFKDNSFAALFAVPKTYNKLRLDFLPVDVKKVRYQDSKRKEYVLTVVLAVLVFMGCLGVVFEKSISKSMVLKNLDSKIKKLEAESSGLSKQRDSVKTIRERMDAQGSALEVLKEIYKVIPDPIYLVAVTYEEDTQVSLRGSAGAQEDIDAFVVTLQNTKGFTQVKTSYSNTRELKDKEYVDFEIVCSLGN